MSLRLQTERQAESTDAADGWSFVIPCSEKIKQQFSTRATLEVLGEVASSGLTDILQLGVLNHVATHDERLLDVV